MKRLLLLSLVVLSAVACKTITPETRIAQIDQFFTGKEAVYSAKLQQFTGEKQLDYLTLQLMQELGAKDLWTLEDEGHQVLVAEFPGKEKKNPQISLISASLDDPTACAAILEVLEAYKKIKIQHKNTIRALFYSPVTDSTGRNGLSVANRDIRESGEMVQFDIELSSHGEQPKHTFILDESPIFAKTLIEVIPGYLAPLGSYQLVQGTYPNTDWPMRCPIYRYQLAADDFQKEAAAMTAFTFLLN
jgi:hypothetical protein